MSKATYRYTEASRLYAKVTVEAVQARSTTAVIADDAFAWLKNSHGDDAWEWPVCDEYYAPYAEYRTRTTREIPIFVCDLPIIEHSAQLFDGAVEKRLFFVRDVPDGHLQQSLPIGSTTEQLGVPPDRAGLQSFAFGVGHAWHDALELSV